MGLFGRKRQKKHAKSPQIRTIDDCINDIAERYFEDGAREAGISIEDFKKKAKLKQQQDKMDYYSHLPEIYDALSKAQLTQALQYLKKYDRLSDIPSRDIDTQVETRALLLELLNNPTWRASDYTDSWPFFIDLDIKYVTLLLNRQ